MPRVNAAVILAPGNAHDLVVDGLTAPMPWHRLQAAWLWRQAGNEETGAGRHSDVRTRPESDWPSRARRPAVAELNATVILPNHFHTGWECPAKSAVPIQEGHQRDCATASQLHNSSSVVPRPEQPGAETPRQAETREGLHKQPGRFRSRVCRRYLPCSMPTRLC